MNLPKWETLLKYYPSYPAPIVFKQIGGKVEYNYDIAVFNNACATRISRALNLSGSEHTIPFYKSIGPNGEYGVQVSSGSAKNWYIFRVKILTKYLTEKYGNPEVYSSETYTVGLSNRKGIIIFVVDGWSDATGHADLWDGNKCVYQDYGSKANEIYFWEASE